LQAATEIAARGLAVHLDGALLFHLELTAATLTTATLAAAALAAGALALAIHLQRVLLS
jgi:hypothetical protein